MYDEKLKNRIYEKLNNALKIYEQLVYQPVGELAHTEGFFTTEHLRSVPESGFKPIAPGTDRRSMCCPIAAATSSCFS